MSKEIHNFILYQVISVLTTAVAGAAGLTGSKWSIVKSPNAGSETNELLGVAADSITNAWAVGLYIDSGGTSKTLTEFYG
jgi:hypothetical protein